MSVWVLTTPGGMKYRLCLKQWYIIPIFTTGKTGTLILTFTSETSSESQSQELNLGILTSKHITLRVLLLTALKMQNKWLKGFHQTVLHLILFFRASPHTRFSAWTWPKTNPFSLSPFKIPFKQQYLYEVGPGSKKPSLSLSLPFSPTLSNGSLQFLVGILSRHRPFIFHRPDPLPRSAFRNLDTSPPPAVAPETHAAFSWICSVNPFQPPPGVRRLIPPDPLYIGCTNSISANFYLQELRPPSSTLTPG